MAQNGVLHGILIDGIAVRAIHERDKLDKRPLVPHSHFLAKPPRRKIVILDIAIQTASAQHTKKMREKRPHRLGSIALSRKAGIEVPPDRDRIPLGMRKQIADHRIGAFQANGNLLIVPAAAADLGQGRVHICEGQRQEQPATGACR